MAAGHSDCSTLLTAYCIWRPTSFCLALQRVFASSMALFWPSFSVDFFFRSNIFCFFKSVLHTFSPTILRSTSMSLFLIIKYTFTYSICIHSIHVVNQFQTIYSNKIYKVQISNHISQLLYIILQMLTNLLLLLRIFLSKLVNLFAISQFKAHSTEPYVRMCLIKVLSPPPIHVRTICANSVFVQTPACLYNR